jgi:hypothetical protein
MTIKVRKALHFCDDHRTETNRAFARAWRATTACTAAMATMCSRQLLRAARSDCRPFCFEQDLSRRRISPGSAPVAIPGYR